MSVISLLKLWEHMRIAFPPIYIYTKYIVLIALPICEADQEKKKQKHYNEVFSLSWSVEMNFDYVLGTRKFALIWVKEISIHCLFSLFLSFFLRHP